MTFHFRVQFHIVSHFDSFSVRLSFFLPFLFRPFFKKILFRLFPAAVTFCWILETVLTFPFPCRNCHHQRPFFRPCLGQWRNLPAKSGEIIATNINLQQHIITAIFFTFWFFKVNICQHFGFVRSKKFCRGQNLSKF